jgi:hypothetical protein
MAGTWRAFAFGQNNIHYKVREVEGIASHLNRAKAARRRWGTRRSPHIRQKRAEVGHPWLLFSVG